MSSNQSASTTTSTVQVQASLSLDDDCTNKFITLVSQEGERFEVPQSQAVLSKLIKSALEMDPNASEIQVNVSTSLMHYIVEYFRLCNGVEMPAITKPLRSNNLKQCINHEGNHVFIEGFYTATCGESNLALYNLINAANYLSFDSLLLIACAKVAWIVKTTPVDKLKPVLHRGLEIPQQQELKEEKENN